MLKNLSMYGWISGLIISILCAIFMGIASNGTSFWNFATLSDNDTDDDSQGNSDFCYSEGFVWPSKAWSLSLSNGLCFPKIPDQNAQAAFGATFGSVFGSDAFNGANCLPWGGKTKGTTSFDMYSDDDGYMATLCNNAALLEVDDLTCDNFDEYSTKFQSAAKAAKAGVAFSVLAAILSIAGLIFQRKEGSTKTAIQGLTGAFLILEFLMTITVLHLASNNNKNPYLLLNNVLAFGCLPGYIDGGAVATGGGAGLILTIVALILSATMGGLSLTISQCFNPCCCPCCFTVDSPISTIQTPIQGNGDNLGGGVRV